MPQLSAESWADCPWEGTQSSYAEIARRAWSVFWVERQWPLSVHSGVHSSSPSESALGSAHSILQLSTRSGSWKKTATEAAQLSGSSWTTSIPAATIPQPPALAYFTSRLCTRFRTNTTKKGKWPWCCFWAEPWTPTQAVHRSSVTAQTSLLQQSPPLGQGMHSRATESDWTWSSGLLLQQLGCRPCSWQGSNSHGAEKKSGLTTCTGSTHYNTNHTRIKGIMASTPLGKTWQMSIPKAVLTPKTLDTQSLHRDVPT